MQSRKRGDNESGGSSLYLMIRDPSLSIQTGVKNTMHQSVLMKEILDGLLPREGDVFLDCTINGGGHSEAVALMLGKSGVLAGIDEDAEALALSKERLKNLPPQKYFFRGNFRNLDTALKDFGIEEVDKVLFDLGLSSNQLGGGERGFSFQKDERLVMTFSTSPGSGRLTAGEIVNAWDEENIATVLESYGEEKFAKNIARAIVFARETKDVRTTKELAEIIENAVPAWYRKGRKHPATKTFQALRMTANDEVGALKEGLAKAWKALALSGRIAVISFHSIEDRIVKNFFKSKKELAEGKIVTKKPLVPTREEVKENARSRSAKLRVIEKIK